MKLGQLALRLTRRISAVLFIAGIFLPVTCFALIISKTGRHPIGAGRLAQATAGQSPACTGSPSGASITLPSPISIAPGASNGKIGSSASVTVTIDCQPPFLVTTNYYDDFTALAGQFAALDTVNAPPGGVGLMFQTSLSGIDVLLTATPTQASRGPNGPNGTPGWALGTVSCDSGRTPYCKPNPISATFTAQLVKTGPVSPGTISSIQLLQLFNSDYVPPNPPGYGSITTYPSASVSYATLTVNPVTVSMSSCSVQSQSKNLTVTLPTISQSALQGTGTVAGSTKFTINYTCPSGWALTMTMSTATPGAAPGVILNSGSCSSPANNVGVQLLQGNQTTPVTFNSSQSLGASPSGTLSIPYYAQYYQTNTPTSAGRVCATATYTMTYQ